MRKRHFPYSFDDSACETCDGKCCRGQSGYIWVTAEEIKIITKAKRMKVNLFARQYLRQVGRRFSFKEYIVNGEHFCCFFSQMDYKCTIYESRPEQCRTFPFWNRFKADPKRLLNECPGVWLGE
ncbi:MAG: YkgJ family cysteine cluster protein [Desulfobacteraceae bacterium]|nr:YkgJ family cysteine cluster protein [Desulfobacteraceae bacterium]